MAKLMKVVCTLLFLGLFLENAGVMGQSVDWDKEIDRLLDVIIWTYGKMKKIVQLDNTEVGERISDILEGQLRKALRIAKEYYDQGGDGSALFNEVSQHLKNIPGLGQEDAQVIEAVFKSSEASGHQRFKRQASRGEAAHNKIAGTFAETGDKIAAEKAKLSPGAQAKTDDAYTSGLKQCKSRECKSELKTFESGAKG